MKLSHFKSLRTRYVAVLAALAVVAAVAGYLTSPLYLEAQGDPQQPISNVSHVANPAKAVVSWSNSSSLPTRIDWQYTNVKKDGSDEEKTWSPFDWNVQGNEVTFTQRPHVNGGDIAGETVTIRLSVELEQGVTVSEPVEYTFTVPSQLLPPANLAAEQDGDDLLVTWEHSYPGAPPEEHVVRWRAVRESTWTERTIPATTSYRIPNAGNEQYVVEVVNVYNRSRDIKSPAASTRPDTISNLTTELRDTTTVGVRWNASSRMTNAAFVVQVRVADSDTAPVYEQAVAVTPESSSYFHEITLDSNSAYDISVQHVTWDASGEVVSIGDSYATSISTPMFPPLNPSAVPGNGNLTLAWDANSGNTVAHSSTVRYRQPGQEWQYRTVTATGVNLASLSPGRYEAEVLNHPAGTAAADYFHQQYTPFPGASEFAVSNFAATPTENAIAVSWDQVSYIGYSPDLPSVRYRDYSDPNAPGGWQPSAHGAQLTEGTTSHNITGLTAGTNYQVELLYTGVVDGAVKTYSKAKGTATTTGTRSTGTAPVAPTVTPTPDTTTTRSSDTSFELLNLVGHDTDNPGETRYIDGKTTYELTLSEDFDADATHLTVSLANRRSLINPESTHEILYYDARRGTTSTITVFALRVPHGERTELKFTVVSEDGLHEQEYNVGITRPAQQTSLLPGVPVYGYAHEDGENIRVEWSANPDGATPTAYKLRYAQVRGQYTGVPGVDPMDDFRYDTFWNVNNLSAWTEIDIPAYEMVRNIPETITGVNGQDHVVAHPTGFSHRILVEDLVHVNSPYRTRSIIVGYVVEAAAVSNHGQSPWVRLQNSKFADTRDSKNLGGHFTPKNHDNIINTPHVARVDIRSMELSDGEVYPPYHPVVWADSRNYRTASVESHVDEIRITADTTDVKGYVVASVNGTEVRTYEGIESAPLPLNIGENLITVKAEDHNGQLSHPQYISVTRAQSTVSKLSALSASYGTLIPEFAPDHADYVLYLPEYRNSITLSADAEEAGATVSITDDGQLALVHGQNQDVTVSVIAPDGVSQRDYNIQVLVPALLTPSVSLTETAVEVPEKHVKVNVPISLAMSSPLLADAEVKLTTSDPDNFVMTTGHQTVTIPAGAVSLNQDVKVKRLHADLSVHDFSITLETVDADSPYHIGLHHVIDVTMIDRSDPPSFADAPDTNLTIAKGEKVRIELPQATNGFKKVTYSSDDLPAGLTLGKNNNVLSGRPEHGQGRKTHVIEALDRDGETAVYAFTVRTTSDISFGSETQPDQTYIVNEPITALQLPNNVAGSVLDILPSRGSRLDPDLPAGLEYNIGSNTVTGTPRFEQDAAKFTLVRTRGQDEDRTSFHIIIRPVDTTPPVITLDPDAPAVRSMTGVFHNAYNDTCVDDRDGSLPITDNRETLGANAGDQILTLTCMDAAGNAASVDVTVGVPHRYAPVANFQVTATATGAALDVTFDVVREPVPIYYAVEHQKDGETAWSTAGVTKVSEGVYTITGLDTNTEYTVRASKEAPVDALAADPLANRTTASAYVTATVRTLPNKADVSFDFVIDQGIAWMVVTLNTVQPNVSEYRIDSEFDYEQELDSYTQTATSTEMTEGVRVLIRPGLPTDVAKVTVTAIGTGTDGQSVTSELGPPDFPPAALGLIFSEVDHDSTVVTWAHGEATDNSVARTGYTVWWAKAGEGYTRARVGADVRTYTIANLERNTRYTVRVVTDSSLSGYDPQPFVEGSVYIGNEPELKVIVTPLTTTVHERTMTTTVKHAVSLSAPRNMSVDATVLTLDGENTQNVRVSPDRMLFQESNYNVPRIVTITFDADAGRGLGEGTDFSVQYKIESAVPSFNVWTAANITVVDEKDTLSQHSWRDASIGTTTIGGYGTIELAGLVKMTDVPLPGAQDGKKITYTVHPPLPNGLSIKATGDSARPFALSGTPTSTNVTTTHQWRANSPGFDQILVIFNIKVTSAVPSFGDNVPDDIPVFTIGSAKTYVYEHKSTPGTGGVTYSLERHDTGAAAPPPPGLTVDTVPDGEENAGYPRIHGTVTGFTSWEPKGTQEYSGGRTAEYQQNWYYLVATDGTGQKARMPVQIGVLQDLKPDLPAMGKFANPVVGQRRTIPTFTGQTNVPFSAQLPTATSGNGVLTYSLNKAQSLANVGLTFNAETSVLSGTPTRDWTELGTDPTHHGYRYNGLVTLTVTDEDGDTDFTAVFVEIAKNPLRASGITTPDSEGRIVWMIMPAAYGEEFPHSNSEIVSEVPQTGGGKVTYRVEGVESTDGHGNTFTPDGLPAGLTFNTDTGKISGTLTGHRGTKLNYVAIASDATYGDEVQRHFYIDIDPKASWKSSVNVDIEMTIYQGHRHAYELPMLWRDGAEGPITTGYRITQGTLPANGYITVVGNKLRVVVNNPTQPQARATYTLAHIGHSETVTFHITVVATQ